MVCGCIQAGVWARCMHAGEVAAAGAAVGLRPQRRTWVAEAAVVEVAWKEPQASFFTWLHSRGTVAAALV